MFRLRDPSAQLSKIQRCRAARGEVSVSGSSSSRWQITGAVSGPFPSVKCCRGPLSLNACIFNPLYWQGWAIEDPMNNAYAALEQDTWRHAEVTLLPVTSITSQSQETQAALLPLPLINHLPGVKSVIFSGPLLLIYKTTLLIQIISRVSSCLRIL